MSGDMSSVIIGNLQEGVTYSVSVGAATTTGAGMISEPFISGKYNLYAHSNCL